MREKFKPELMQINIRLISSICMLFCYSLIYGQIQEYGSHVIDPTRKASLPEDRSQSLERSGTNCGPDTIQFARVRASALPAISLHLTQSANKLGQYFTAPQPVTVHGFTFYAYKADGSGGTIDLWAKIYKTGPDSLPTGPALDSVQIAVDSSRSSLNKLRYTAEFQNPITLDTPYVVALETEISRTTNVITTSWDSLDGRQSWLGMGHIVNQGWLHGYEVYINGTPFDADVALEPIVTYDLTAGFTTDTSCILDTGTVQFTSESSPILTSPFYNQLAYLDTLSLAYEWQFGDGSPPQMQQNVQHIYEPGHNNKVKHINTMLGWTSSCVDSTSRIINQKVQSDFTYQNAGLTIDFSNAISGTADSVEWFFGDNTGSGMMNPSHTYSTPGNYEVCLLAKSECTSDTTCKSITVCDSLGGDFSFTPNGNTIDFSANAAGYDTLYWRFDDGNTSTNTNPTHAYESGGTYEPCLFVGNACRVDTLCKSINVTSVENRYARDGLNIYPVPTKGEFIIEMKDDAFDSNKSSTMSLFNADGVLLMNREFKDTDGDKYQMDLSRYEPGIYFLQIKNEAQILRRKITILR